MHDYIIWLNRPNNQYKKIIRSPRSLNDAIKQYIRELPHHLSTELVESIRYERVKQEEVMV